MPKKILYKARRKRYIRKRKYRINRQFRPSQIYHFTRFKKIDTTISSAALTDTSYTFAFRLTDLDNNSEFTSLYDQYKIHKIEVILIQRGMTENIDPINFVVPTMLYATDPDDIAGTTLTELLQFSNVRMVPMTKRVVRIKIYPKLAVSLFRPTISNGTGIYTGYVDCGTPDVPHYGLKIITRNSQSAGAFSYEIYFKYYVSFKGVR